MRIRTQLAATGCALILLTGLVGCTGQPPSTDTSAHFDTTQSENSETDTADTPTMMIDPAWPWPQQLPRPSVPITSEFSGPNILGEGGIYTVEFTVPSVDHAQEYADALAASGISWMLDGRFLEAEPGETEVSVVGMAEGYMTTLTVNTKTLHTVFSFIGELG